MLNKIKNMIFKKSFISFVLIVTLVVIYIKDYNEVEANLLEKLNFKGVKQEFRSAYLKQERNRIPTSSLPNQITSVLALTKRTNSTETSTTTGKILDHLN